MRESEYYSQLKFIDRCLINIETPLNIGKYFLEWYRYRRNKETLAEFLGITEEEYKLFGSNLYSPLLVKRSIVEIINKRKKSNMSEHKKPKRKTFMDKCLDGTETYDNVERYVAVWYRSSRHTKTLAQFLGFTDKEYCQWLINPNCIEAIINTRKNRVT